MTITDLRGIAAASGIRHAETCLEDHTTQIGRKAAEPLWLEMARLWDEHNAANEASLDGLELPDAP
jgi:hypothetical protein